MNPLIKILLAEDDLDDQYFFKEAVVEFSSPVELTIVNNGKELMDALTLSDDIAYDLVILDVNMPLKNGIECLQEISEDKKFDKVKCVLLTTSINDTLFTKARDLGVYQIFTKPYDFDEYKVVVNNIISIGKN